MTDIAGYAQGWRDSQPEKARLLNGGEPALANCFLFKVDGAEIGIFKDVKGLEFTVNTVPIKEGGQNHYVHHAMGGITWSNITLSRGMTQSDAMLKWVQESSGTGYAGNKNTITRPTGAIIAISYTGDYLRTWNLADCYPVKWRGPEFSVDSKASLEESIEIAHHGFTSDTQKPKA